MIGIERIKVMGIFNKKKAGNNKTLNKIPLDRTVINNRDGEELIDDLTFINSIRHISANAWHQYDVHLEARGYGWDQMLDWADYMANSDVSNISEITVSGIANSAARNITSEYDPKQNTINNLPSLSVEQGCLTIAGASKTLRAPVKIVWFNQTRFLRFFTFVDDELLMEKYIETTIRRTFGTKNEMKLAKPIIKDSNDN